MTEPTRDALHAETLHYLEFQRDDKLRIDANRTAMGMVPSPAWKRDAAMFAHAAECVRRVPELEAEVERLRAKAAIVDAMEKRHINVRYLGADKDGELETPWRVEGVSFKGFAHGPTIAAAYAAATREGTDATK